MFPSIHAIEHYDQAEADRLRRAVARAGGDEKAATRLARLTLDNANAGRVANTAGDPRIMQFALKDAF